ncbi:MAG: glycosyl transferase [Lutibacter sp. BRH_c52]|nr:MAG: glycosyl transferase [Lutibacter sp. BRH_c52]
MYDTTFSILITTKNRKADLIFTLNKISCLLEDASVNCVVFDDGSVDGTYEYVIKNYPYIQVERNAVSKGYIYCRNKMLNETKSTYAISLDDDAHFISGNPLQFIHNHFEQNANCGLIALRIFWGLQEPSSTFSKAKSERVQGFVGCAHVWRMEAWKSIPNYPEWFVFYGEENFASYQLFKKNWEVYYLPEVLVNHRVDVKSRKNNTDYSTRLRRSLRSGWYLYIMFYPWMLVPRKIAYSLWMQIKVKVMKGDFKAMLAIMLAMGDLLINLPRLFYNAYRLNTAEFKAYTKLAETKLYWTPEET